MNIRLKYDFIINNINGFYTKDSVGGFNGEISENIILT